MGLIEIRKIKTSTNKVEKASTDPFNNLKSIQSAIRPLTDSFITGSRNAKQWSLNQFAFNFITLVDLFYLKDYADILQLIFNARVRETFRNGFDLQPNNQRASKQQKALVDKMLYGRVNDNGQSLSEVLSEFCKDLDWADNAYLLCLKDWLVNESNEVIGGDVKEVLRLNPLTVEKVMDHSNRLGYDIQGDKAYFDMQGRQLCKEKYNTKTGLPNIRAHYKVQTTGGVMYYNETEILHKSEHNPSITYGLSPLFSLYPKVLILITQDDFVKKYYGSDKPPKGFMLFNTDNRDSLITSLDEMSTKTKQNPHMIYPLVTQKRGDSKTDVQFIDMARSLQEMQFTEGRNEYRQQIGAMYGVSPIFQNDVSTSGGLNNEGLQITVTNRAIEQKQTIFNDFVLPFLFKQNLGITDWSIKLFPSEEQDEVAELDKEKKELENIKLRLEMGQKVTQDENGKFIIESGELKLEKQSQEFLPFQNMSADKVDVVTPVKTKAVTKAKERLPKTEERKFKTALDKELEKIIKDLDFKNKPTEQQLKQTVDKLTKNLSKQLKAKSANRVKTIYRKASEQVSKEIKTKYSPSEKDKNIIEALKRDEAFQNAFSGLGIDLSKKLKTIITDAYDNKEGFTIDSLVKDMRTELKDADSQLRRIARTETSKISIAARKTNYQKLDNFDERKFKWLGPNDNRTGEDSKQIKNRVGKGVTWEKLVKIIQEVSNMNNKNWKVDKTSPIPRPNTRHVPVLVV